MKSKNALTVKLCAACASILTMLLAGCGTLDKSGPYKGDNLLYQSEMLTVTAKAVLDTYVSWEYQNRATLAHLPNVKASADNIRKNAKKWFSTAAALHDAYKTDPSAPNKAALSTVLDVLRAAVAEASNYMNSATVIPPPPGAIH